MQFRHGLAVLGIFAVNLASAATDVSREDLDTWIKQTIVVDPPVAGTIIGAENLDLSTAMDTTRPD